MTALPPPDPFGFGYSVKEVLDQVSGKLDGLAATIASHALTTANLITRVEAIEKARAEVSSRSWGLIAALLTGGTGVGAAVATAIAALTQTPPPPAG